MHNKKGLSEVVTNVLIILLVVVAVGLLWGFLSPLFTKGGDKITQAESCINLEVSPIKCAIMGNSTNITVKRNEAKADIKELKVIFELADGSTTSVAQTTNLPAELETKVYTNVSVGAVAKKFSIAVGLANADGTVSYCKESARQDCV